VRQNKLTTMKQVELTLISIVENQLPLNLQFLLTTIRLLNAYVRIALLFHQLIELNR